MASRIKRGVDRFRGISLMEAIFGVGILALAVLTLLSLCSSVLRYRRQSTNHLNAARVTDMVLERTVVSLASDPAVRDDFWDDEYPYPTTPYQTGTQMVGRQNFSFAIYASDVPGIGDPSADPPNVLRRVDVYAWWEDEKEPGSKKTCATRIINHGEEP